MIHLARGLQHLEAPTRTRCCILHNYMKLLTYKRSCYNQQLVLLSLLSLSYPFWTGPLIHCWLQFQPLVLNFRLFSGLGYLKEHLHLQGKTVAENYSPVHSSTACGKRSTSDLRLDWPPPRKKLPSLCFEHQLHFSGFVFLERQTHRCIQLLKPNQTTCIREVIKREFALKILSLFLSPCLWKTGEQSPSCWWQQPCKYTSGRLSDADH